MSGLDRAMQLRGQINKGEQPNIKAPKKTIAGGVTSTIGGAATLASLAPTLGTPAAPLAVIGGILGGAEYFTS